MAKIKARLLGKSSLLESNSTPFRLAWLIPRSNLADRQATEKVLEKGQTLKSLLVRVRETLLGYEGYAIRSKHPLQHREWSGAEWRVLEIGKTTDGETSQAAQ